MYMKRFANGLKNYQMVTTENNIIAFKLVTSTTRFIYNEQLKTLMSVIIYYLLFCFLENISTLLMIVKEIIIR